MCRDSHSDRNLLGHHPSIPPVPGHSSVKENRKTAQPVRQGDQISIPRWITGVESKTTKCAGTGQRGWIQ